MPAVEQAVKKVTSRCSTRLKKAEDTAPEEIPESTPPVAGDVKEKEDIKPVTVPKNLLTKKDGNPVLAVEIQQLVIYPARDKLPTARHGKPFR